MIKEIKLSDKVSIYKTKIETSNRLKLIESIRYNKEFSLTTSSPSKTQPGWQSRILISTPEIEEITNNVKDIFFKLFNLEKSTPYYHHQWSYISENTNNHTGWHTHINNFDTVTKNKWTYTYYVQMPDNLIEDDGKLAFKLESNEVHMVLPEVDDLYIFPSTLLHAPITNTNSILERIVIAGVWSDIDLGVTLKNNKTLL